MKKLFYLKFIIILFSLFVLNIFMQGVLEALIAVHYRVYVRMIFECFRLRVLLSGLPLEALFLMQLSALICNAVFLVLGLYIVWRLLVLNL